MTHNLSPRPVSLNTRRALAVGAALSILLVSGCAGRPASPGGGAPSADVATPSPIPVAAEPTPVVVDSPSPTAEPTTPAPVDCQVEKCVALTYDDGPTPLTNQLLDTLVAKQAVATFFLYGAFIDSNPAAVARTHELGMQIGNHTTYHPMLTQQTPDQITFELDDTQARIHAITGQYPTIMRPPYGDHNATVDNIAGQLGLAVINWTDSPADWEPQDAASVAERTLNRVRPGAIILMHDTKQWTVDAAPAIIDGLRAQGYVLVTVDQIIGTPAPGQAYTAGQAPA